MASVTVDIDIDEFDDDEILEAAADVIQRMRKQGEPGRRMRELVAKLREAILAEEPDGATGLPTASRLANFESLKRLVEEHPELYRFAGRPE